MKKKARFSLPEKEPESPKNSNDRKKNYLINKFNLTKDSIKIADIEALIKNLNSVNSETIKLENAKIIFNLIDKKKLGKIPTNVFLEEVIKRNSNDAKINSEIDIFFIEMNNAVATTSEVIISRLKRLRNQNWLNNDKEGISDLNWIINVITQENLYDLDTNIIQKHWKSKQKDDIAYLIKYSEIEGNTQKENDYKKIRKVSRINKSGYSKRNRNDENNNLQNLRRNTRLNELISPSIILTLNEQMKKINTPEFNIFELNEVLEKRTSIYIANEILSPFEILENEIIPKSIFKNFIEKIISGYNRKNAIYHNDLHAGDVMQTSYTILNQGKLIKKMKLGQLDTFSLLIACLCHDFKHPGQNNLYQINAKTKYAMRYNDISVLENYHVSQTFKVLQIKETNLFINFSPEEYRICRRRMIDCILSTDMANHQKVLSAVKIKIENYDIEKGKNFEKIFEDNNEDDLGKLYENQQCILNMIIHGSDISNPAKPSLWTKRVYDEFFIQGDLEKEKGLTVSMFCDRESTNVNKAMIGFINFVVLPSIIILVNLVKEVEIYKDYCKFNLKKHQIAFKNDEKKERAKLKNKNKSNK